MNKLDKQKDQIVSTLKALCRNEQLVVNFDQNQINNFSSWNQKIIDENKNQINLPEFDKELFEYYRASIDIACSYILFHQKEIHQTKSFDEEEQKIFDNFEKVRVILEIKNFYRGSFFNLLKKIDQESHLLEDSIYLLILENFIEPKIFKNLQKIILEKKKDFNQETLRAIDFIAKNTSDQKLFSQLVEKLIIDLRKSYEKENNEELKNNNSKSSEDDSNLNQENVDQNQHSFEKNLQENEQNSKKESLENKNLEEKIIDAKEENDEGNINVFDNFEGEKIEFINRYKIFTNQFDEIIFPQKLIKKSELELLRDQLDLRISKLEKISKKITLKLKKKLLSKKDSFLQFASRRGIIDRKKLSHLIIDPFLEDVWINVESNNYQDTALTILIDNSGSMRGNPIVMSALVCEIIANILESFSIKTEIIGFTTIDWKGGKSRKLWEENASPKNPGRLNDLRHIIYKSFGQKFKKSKINLGLMLKEGILKENIDGEALLFAKSRLLQQNEKRKIMMVISDGTPIDDSTSIANDQDILTDHLKSVIHKIEKQSKIEIIGIGIGHSTKDFYRNSITIKNIEDLGDAMIEKMMEII
jgi:cobaltochelatase CobT